MNALETFRTEEARRAANQELVNEVFGLDATAARVLIRITAKDAHREFPQYDGHWSGVEWKLARVTKRVKTKGGVRFEAGDIVIVRAHSGVPDFDGDRCFPTAYSVRGEVDCSMNPNSFTLI